MKKKLVYHNEKLLVQMVKFINENSIQRDDILTLEKGDDGLFMLLYYA